MQENQQCKLHQTFANKNTRLLVYRRVLSLERC